MACIASATRRIRTHGIQHGMCVQQYAMSLLSMLPELRTQLTSCIECERSDVQCHCFSAAWPYHALTVCFQHASCAEQQAPMMPLLFLPVKCTACECSKTPLKWTHVEQNHLLIVLKGCAAQLGTHANLSMLMTSCCDHMAGTWLHG